VQVGGVSSVKDRTRNNSSVCWEWGAVKALTTRTEPAAPGDGDATRPRLAYGLLLRSALLCDEDSPTADRALVVAAPLVCASASRMRPGTPRGGRVACMKAS